MMPKSKLSLVIFGVSLLCWLQERPNLFAQFRILGMPVMHNGMAHGGFQHFFFSPLDAQGATAFAGMLATVDRFSF